MSNVIIFDLLNKRVESYLKSVHTPDYEEQSNVLVNPENLPDILQKYWKVGNEQVLEMNQVEKDTLDIEEKQKKKKYRQD